MAVLNTGASFGRIGVEEVTVLHLTRMSPARARKGSFVARSGSLARFRHRRLSFSLLKTTSRFAATRSASPDEKPGTPCTLPRSATGCLGCTSAALEPSRRISPSDSRGIITGNPAWSDGAIRRPATGKITCVPSSLVCTSPHPLARSSIVQKAVVAMTCGCDPSCCTLLIDTLRACGPSPPRVRQHPVRSKPDRRHRRCRRSTSHA